MSGVEGQVSRTIRITDEYRLCLLCELVWNWKQNVCPPHLRSEIEDRMLAELRRKSS